VKPPHFKIKFKLFLISKVKSNYFFKILKRFFRSFGPKAKATEIRVVGFWVAVFPSWQRKNWPQVFVVFALKQRRQKFELFWKVLRPF
jgi:hypothetical protein